MGRAKAPAWTGQDPVRAEQVDRMRRGGTVIAQFQPRRADPTYTLGGVATGSLG